MKRHTVRVTIYRRGPMHIDLKLRPSAWFAEVRVWRGQRWPVLERTWRARMRRWIPWYSLERQALRAVEYVEPAAITSPTQQEIRREVAAALQRLEFEAA